MVINYLPHFLNFDEDTNYAYNYLQQDQINLLDIIIVIIIWNIRKEDMQNQEKII